MLEKNAQDLYSLLPPPTPSQSPTASPATSRGSRAFSKIKLGLIASVLAISTVWAYSRLAGGCHHGAALMFGGGGNELEDDALEVGDYAGLNLGLSERLGYTLVKDIPSENIPGRGKNGVQKGDGDDKRLIVVGDIHGMFDEFQSLLDKVSYDSERDYLILAGDIISKGPDSLAVLDLARKIGAHCVRGNHEDKILLHYHNIQRRKRGHHRAVERKLAKSLSKKQAKWLDACPLVVRAKKVPGLGQYYIVHAGLVHGIGLESQDPLAIMTMRSLNHHLVPSPKQTGMHWAKYWNKMERKKTHDHTTVVYGHYAAEGLDIHHYTKGLDSNCVRGGKLSAYILEANKDGRVGEDVVSVRCRAYLD
ncbi:Metallo-dependent phosphatase [Choiromyces venosus 120613-1]|uniref:Metallo-dependent phosphatase n=1 Tax=Choiromyces venosus 120613-1 TaxID=1336337 RepID=A0A3N4K7C4_9PEZI|nr:Metallo-dependent phosphatase [Choiromyces venosus 120613-1]